MVKPSNLASSSSSSSTGSTSAVHDKAASVHMAIRVDVTASEVKQIDSVAIDSNLCQ
jgi:hypothetical protein